MFTKQKNKMSKETNKTENATPKVKKEKVARVSAKQVIAERKNKGIVAIMAKVAFNIGAKNNFEGTTLETIVLDDKGKSVLDENGKKQIAECSSQHATIYHLAKPSGIIDGLDEKGENWKNLLEKAKKCKEDLSAEEVKYSKDVKNFINDLLKLKTPTESNSVVLRGVSFS